MIEKWGAVIASTLGSVGMILDWISTAIALSNSSSHYGTIGQE